MLMSGIDAREAAQLLGKGWTAKSLRYTGIGMGCCLCNEEGIYKQFMTWDNLVNYVNSKLELEGKEPYVRYEPDNV